MEQWERKRIKRIDAIIQFIISNEGINQKVLTASLFLRWGMSPKSTVQYLEQLETAKVIEVIENNVFLSEKRKDIMVQFEEAKTEADLLKTYKKEESNDLSSSEVVTVVASAEVDQFFDNIGEPVNKPVKENDTEEDDKDGDKEEEVV